MLGALTAIVIGTATAYLLDYLSPYFRTPEEVEDALDLPVLASLPARR
jgi:capsular polysaccharide biosynthesis protein